MGRQFVSGNGQAVAREHMRDSDEFLHQPARWYDLVDEVHIVQSAPTRFPWSLIDKRKVRVVWHDRQSAPGACEDDTCTWAPS